MLIPILIAAVLVVILTYVALHAANILLFFKQSYYLGVQIWVKWLPLMACLIFFTVLFINLVGEIPASWQIFNIKPTLARYELVTLIIISPFFLSSLGNVLSLLVTLYLSARVFSFPVALVNQYGLFILLGSATFITLLADRFPWVTDSFSQRFGHLIREASSFLISVGALSILLASIFKLSDLTQWSELFLGFSTPAFVIFILIFLILISWVAISIGLVNPAPILPVIGIPTIYVSSFIIKDFSCLLVVPIAIYLSLMLTSSDRRLRFRA